jgi:hypothetical protein
MRWSDLDTILAWFFDMFAGSKARVVTVVQGLGTAKLEDWWKEGMGKDGDAKRDNWSVTRDFLNLLCSSWQYAHVSHVSWIWRWLITSQEPQANKTLLTIAGSEHWNNKHRTVLYTLWPTLILFRVVHALSSLRKILCRKTYLEQHMTKSLYCNKAYNALIWTS